MNAGLFRASASGRHIGDPGLQFADPCGGRSRRQRGDGTGICQGYIGGQGGRRAVSERRCRRSSIINGEAVG
jgi:hypothetical protein